MKNLLHTLFLVGLAQSPFTQSLSVSSIHDIEPAENHYASLQEISSLPNPSKAWMDTLTYPPEIFNNYTLLFPLVKPQYLTSSQVDFLVQNAQFPANSSDQVRAELDYLLNYKTIERKSKLKE